MPASRPAKVVHRSPLHCGNGNATVRSLWPPYWRQTTSFSAHSHHSNCPQPRPRVCMCHGRGHVGTSGRPQTWPRPREATFSHHQKDPLQCPSYTDQLRTLSCLKGSMFRWSLQRHVTHQAAAAAREGAGRARLPLPVEPHLQTGAGLPRDARCPTKARESRLPPHLSY